MKNLPEQIYFDLEDLAKFSPTHATADELEKDDGLIKDVFAALIEVGELDQDGHRPAEISYGREDDELLRLDIERWEKVD